MGQKPDTSTRRLAELVERFDNAILITRNDRAPSGVHGRPMAIAKVGGDSDLWFITSLDSPKAEEIAVRPDVLVTLQGPSTYIVVQGNARVVRDTAKIAEVWHETYKVWFPEGKEDPSIALVHVTVTSGEFWDLRAKNRLVFMWEAAKAYFRQQQPHEIADLHGTVGDSQIPTTRMR